MPGTTVRPGSHRKSGYRLYMERCLSARRTPMDFDDFLVAARRWRVEYEAARARGDVALMRELEELLCERPGTPAQPASKQRKRGKRLRTRR